MQNLDKNCRVCMEWQEHCYWSHMADDQKHFFKPMVGDFTETMVRNHLKIAPQFSSTCECPAEMNLSGFVISE